MERGTHVSLCSTCNSDYARADKTSINQAINTIDWEDFFANKTVGSLVSELNTFKYLFKLYFEQSCFKWWQRSPMDN